MNCETIREHLGAYLDGELDTRATAPAAPAAPAVPTVPTVPTEPAEAAVPTTPTARTAGSAPTPDEIAGHLAECVACATTLSRLRALGDYLREHGHAAVPADLLARIEDAAEISARPLRPHIVRWLAPRLAAAALGALCVSTAWLTGGRPGGRTGIPAPHRPAGAILARYLRASGATAASAEIQRLRWRPENRVLAWARTENENR